MPLDTRLVEAVDDYLAELREKMLARLVIGEAEHSGQWMRVSLATLQRMRDEEIEDYHVYGAMINWRETHGVH